MARTVVIYKSKYGTTKKYAEWIAEETRADLFELSQVSLYKILQYDTVVFGGYLYGGRIKGLSIISKNFSCLNNKDIVVFVVGASTTKENVLKDVERRNFKKELKEKISIFHLRGIMDYSKLRGIDKILVGVMKKIVLTKKGQLSQGEDEFLRSVDNPGEDINKESVEPIVNCIRTLEKIRN